MVDFSTYKPPGVYVEDITGPVVSPFGIPITTVCIIGPGSGYQMYSEVLIIPASTTVGTPLFQRGAFITASAGYPATGGHPGIVVTELDGITVLVKDTDFGVTDMGTDENGKIWGIVNTSTGSSKTVVVTYAYAKLNYYDPQEFTDYDTIVDTYGQAMVSDAPVNPLTTEVYSPITLAAKIAFENGASTLILVATDPATVLADDYAQALRDAYDKILADTRVNVVVPLWVEGAGGSADAHTYINVKGMLDNLVTHCVQSTNNGFGRIGLVGLMSTFGVQGSGFLDLAAEGAGTGNGNRIVIAYPNLMNYYNGSTNQIITIDGPYLAAAYAGRLATIPVQKPLTKEIIRGFSGIPASIAGKMTRTFKDNLSKNGIAVAEVDRQNRVSIRHGVTTDMSSILTRELSIIRARDFLFEMCQLGTEAANLIGEPITEDTPIQVKAAVVNTLESALIGGVIINYTNVQVRQQKLPPGDPTIIEVKFVYLPAVPLNYIVVQFAIDLNSGSTTLTELAAA